MIDRNATRGFAERRAPERLAGRESLRFTVDRLGPLTILHVMGTVDIANGSKLEAEIENASRAHSGPLIVAFVECTDDDGTILEILHRRSQTLAERLLIVARPQNGLRQTTGLSRTVPRVYDGFQEAILAVCQAHERERAMDRDGTSANARSAEAERAERYALAT